MMNNELRMLLDERVGWLISMTEVTLTIFRPKLSQHSANVSSTLDVRGFHLIVFRCNKHCYGEVPYCISFIFFHK